MSTVGHGKRKVAEETKMLVSFYRTKRRAPLRRSAGVINDDALEYKLAKWLRDIRQRVCNHLLLTTVYIRV